MKPDQPWRCRALHSPSGARCLCSMAGPRPGSRSDTNPYDHVYRHIFLVKGKVVYQQTGTNTVIDLETEESTLRSFLLAPRGERIQPTKEGDRPDLGDAFSFFLAAIEEEKK